MCMDINNVKMFGQYEVIFPIYDVFFTVVITILYLLGDYITSQYVNAANNLWDFFVSGATH